MFFRSKNKIVPYVLLHDATIVLLKIWLPATILIILLFALMVVGQVFENILPLANIWLLSNLFPTCILLFSILNNKGSQDKLVLRNRLNLISIIYSIYLVAIFMTLFTSEYWIYQNPLYSINSILMLSYWYLGPWQALILFLFWSLSAKESKMEHNPKSSTIHQYINQKIEYFNKTGNTNCEHAYNLLAHNEIEKVFDLLQTEIRASDDRHQLIVLKSEYNRWNESLQFGTEEKSVVVRHFNKITLALCEQIERLLK